MNPKSAVSKHIKLLEGLLKLPENKECADCRSKAPRWASTNLGIFICLQCSGIHRSLGVHISKVRSVTLDTWLPEQVAFMQSTGNEKSNAYWEKVLPRNYDRGRIENFIHAKYVQKRWIPSDCRVKSPPRVLPRLGSSRSTRRFGSIAEWTNSQHSCKLRRDGSTGERDRIGSSTANDEVHRAYAVNNKHLQKNENIQPSVDQNACSLISVNGELSKESAQVVPNLGTNGSLQKSEEEVLRNKSSIANVMPAVSSAKVDYANGHFRSLSMNDSAENDSSPPNTTAWVHFDSDQESLKPVTKIVQKSDVQETLIYEAKLIPKFTASKVYPVQKIEDVHLQKPKLVSPSSIHLQRLAMLAEGVASTNAPNLHGSIHHQGVNSFQQQQLSVNEERPTGTHMPMQHFQPVKLAVNPAPSTRSSLYAPAIPSKGVSTIPTTGPAAALPVSGYDYDFSFLTQGMFAKR